MGVCRQCAIAACLLICACGPTPEPSADAEPIDEPDAAPVMPELEGQWIFENVSATPTQMGFHPEAGVLRNGQAWVVWAEVDETNLSDMDIFVAERGQSLWSSIPLTSNDQVQHTFPSMVVDDDQAFVVWNGRSTPSDDLDLFLAIGTDGNWSQPIDLTSLSESSETRDDIRPEIALSDQGLLVIAYVSSPVGSFTDSEIRVITVSKTGTPSTPQTVTSGIDNCNAIDAAASPLGFHVAARCSGGMFYASNESGQWLNQPLAMDVAGALTPALAVDQDGVVHAVWSENGANSKDDIFHAFREGPGPFSTPRNITQTPDNNDTKPTVAIDPFGRVVVAWQDTDDDDVKFTYADETLFRPAMNLTPQSPETDDQSPSIAFDPKTGVPIIVIERSFVGSDPINVDVFALRLAN